MATLNEVMNETADAIREKTGKSEKIAPINFAEEIKSISAGGESGGSEYEYFALTDGWTRDLGISFPYYSSLWKAAISGAGVVIASPLRMKIINNNESVIPAAVAVDMSLMYNIGEQQVTTKDMILEEGTTEEALAKYRITKEQFYDLNA